jgi:predicted PurR-regulated permease PerM
MSVKELNFRKYFTIAIVLLLVFLVFYLFLDIFILLAISTLIALIFNPVVTYLEKFRIKRTVGTLIVFFVVGGFLTFVSSLLLPKLISQFEVLYQNLNQEKISSLVNQIQIFIKRYIPFTKHIDLNKKIVDLFSNLFGNLINNVSDILTGIFSVIAILVIVPFMTFFILKDTKRIHKGIVNLLPNRYFEMSYLVIGKIGEQLGRFVRGWILDATFVGVMVAIALSLLGVQNAISIGFVAGIGHLIPYFGPLIGGLPAIIISLIQFGDFTMLPAIFLTFLLIYTIDNGFVQPNILSKSTDMHPLIIIILIIIGDQLLSVVGMLLAVPVATVIKTAAFEIYHGFKKFKITKM